MEAYADMTAWFLKQQETQAEPVTRIARPVLNGCLQNSGVPRWASEYMDTFTPERAWAFYKWLQAYKRLHVQPAIEALMMLLCARIAQRMRTADEQQLTRMFGAPRAARTLAEHITDYAWALGPDAPWAMVKLPLKRA